MKRAEDTAQGHSQLFCLNAVDVYVKLRHVRPKVAVHSRKQRVFVSFEDHQIGRLCQCDNIRSGLILQLELEPTGRTQAGNRRRHESQRYPFLYLREFRLYPGNDVLHMQRFAAALAPVLKYDETRAGVGAVERIQGRVSGNRNNVGSAVRFFQYLVDLVHYPLCSHQRGTVWQTDGYHEVTLVLVGNEAGGYGHEPGRQKTAKDAEQQHRDNCATNGRVDHAHVSTRGAVEYVIETAEEPTALLWRGS